MKFGRCALTEEEVSGIAGVAGFTNLHDASLRGTVEMQDHDLNAVTTASVAHASVAVGNGEVKTISRRK